MVLERITEVASIQKWCRRKLMDFDSWEHFLITLALTLFVVRTHIGMNSPAGLQKANVSSEGGSKEQDRTSYVKACNDFWHVDEACIKIKKTGSISTETSIPEGTRLIAPHV
jgi:hypothetical protein